MIVAYSRKAAYMMYKEILEQRPSWNNKVKMVMTTNNQDSEEMAKLIGTKKTQKQREDEFRDLDSEFKIVIVVDMWLTGFDAPSVSTLYLDKPMKGHTLMQTIARANRVYNGKECGLIIDYLDVFKYLKRALADYASDDGGLMPVKDVDKLLGQLHEAVSYTHLTLPTNREV